MKKTITILGIGVVVLFVLMALAPAVAANQPPEPDPISGGRWYKVVDRWQDLYKTISYYWNGYSYVHKYYVVRIELHWHWVWIPDNQNTAIC